MTNFIVYVEQLEYEEYEVVVEAKKYQISQVRMGRN